MSYPKIVYLECVLMANCEVIHFGKTLGFISQHDLEKLDNDCELLPRVVLQHDKNS